MRVRRLKRRGPGEGIKIACVRAQLAKAQVDYYYSILKYMLYIQ